MRIQRDQVISSALALLAEDGIEGLTLRKLALALQIQAPSLYWHFPNKQALIDGMADALVETVARDISPTQPWDDQARLIALELRQALLAHRDGARVFAGTYVVTDNVLRTSDALIGAFVRSGASAHRAASASLSLLYFILGFVMEEQALGVDSTIDVTVRKDAFFRLAQSKYPHCWEARHTFFSEDFDSRFSEGLNLFIAGFKSTL